MVNKVKNKFLISDHQVSLLRKMKILKEKDMIVKEYTKEFYKLDIRFEHVDDDVEKIVRYINGLRSEIQDEIVCEIQKCGENIPICLESRGGLDKEA